MEYVSFVILHYKDYSVTDTCVRSILAMEQQERIRIVIVDNDIQKKEKDRQELLQKYQGTIGSALAGGYRAAVYCRLSKDDDLQGESASIANQRDMLEKYCEKQGWEVVAVYQDDGFTGLNMERPDLQRMLRAIERRQINLVITKDLSRLGRNYLQTGHLIEDFFPRNGVRYIAMNDGIDTLRDNNDIAPFKNILNEMYSKDISKNRAGCRSGEILPSGSVRYEDNARSSFPTSPSRSPEPWHIHNLEDPQGT